ncbi:MAG: hypothetical protein F9K23_00630 [Bacteroidetes bacterium]|nr:MAG: hypothetical protein F9K23_00630 [Bacteroidota bacterium]
MIYLWNIRDWIERVLPYFLRDAKNIAWLYVLLNPVETLHGFFLSTAGELDYKLKYNSQQKVLAALLNNVFDDTLRRIYIVTNSDGSPVYYLYKIVEGEPPLYVYKTSESASPRYVYTIPEQIVSGQFTVYVPAALSVSESLIIARVNYYKLAGTTFTIKYF